LRHTLDDLVQQKLLFRFALWTFLMCWNDKMAVAGTQMGTPKLLRVGVVAGSIILISALHYHVGGTHIWLHPLLLRAYYIPVLLAGMWYGWRGGLLAAGLAALLYVPLVIWTWKASAYAATQYAEVGMFFVIGGLAGGLFDLERGHRAKIEETARKLGEVYAQLQSSFEQLRRADRLTALGELSAGLAHEIRNPLGSIEGAVQILRRPNLAEEGRQEFGKMAAEEIGRLKGLLTHFLQFARPRAPQRSVTEISELFDAVRRLADETAKMTGARVTVERGAGLPTVAIDPDQIKQVLLNLVLNAIQAMPHGGEVVLRAAPQDGDVRLEVQDEGVGIAEQDLQKIFDPFFTTRQGGTGLGLSIAHQIVTQHGGRIEVKRNPERGMTFSVVLPLQSAEKFGPEFVTRTRALANGKQPNLDR
jgi:two-component system, NtrC family, sensor histidine kinase HydH